MRVDRREEPDAPIERRARGMTLPPVPSALRPAAPRRPTGTRGGRAHRRRRTDVARTRRARPRAGEALHTHIAVLLLVERPCSPVGLAVGEPVQRIVVRAPVRREVLVRVVRVRMGVRVVPGSVRVRRRGRRGGVVEQIVLLYLRAERDVARREAREDRAQLCDAREDVVRGGAACTTCRGGGSGGGGSRSRCRWGGGGGRDREGEGRAGLGGYGIGIGIRAAFGIRIRAIAVAVAIGFRVIGRRLAARGALARGAAVAHGAGGRRCETLGLAGA
ncbi:hypothetical protein B0H11DRAFT_2127496 [Mycena galericulata]|nr:hypothetical protein B0H11DRAFT_2127496 [Mycena galericulata]